MKMAQLYITYTTKMQTVFVLFSTTCLKFHISCFTTSVVELKICIDIRKGQKSFQLFNEMVLETFIVLSINTLALNTRKLKLDLYLYICHKTRCTYEISAS